MSFFDNVDKDTKKEIEEKEENLQELRNERRENVINRGYYIPEDLTTSRSENNYDDSDDDFDEHDMIRLQLIRHYETKNQKIREYINKGHILKNGRLLFSYDSKPIPYIDYDDKDRLINGKECYAGEKENYFDKLKYDEFTCFNPYTDKAYDFVKFERDRTPEEDQFMADYYTLTSYSQIRRINDFVPNTTNPFTINIFNELKEILKEVPKQKIAKNKQPKLFLTFTLDNNGYPYRSYNKLTSLYEDFNRYKFKENIKPLNNFDLSKAKKQFNLKTYSRYKYSFIGDIFFESNKAAFLLLININTRFAYAYELGEVDKKEIHDVDNNQDIITKTYVTKGRKTTSSLKTAIIKHLLISPINILRFDGEKAIQSNTFKKFMKENGIKFIPAQTEAHTSLSLIDRLCRTIRDIAFNLGYYDSNREQKGVIDQKIMDIILKYYNNSRHETLSQTLFKAYPELKSVYDFISPAIMENNPYDLETKFVKECIKYNLSITSKDDYTINKNDTVEIYNNTSKLEKKRSKISKDKYKIIKKESNIFKLKNINNDKDIIYKPRYQIRYFK